MQLKLLLRILCATTLSYPAIAAVGPETVYGIDFGPYIAGQSPDAGSQISAAQIRSRMEIIAPRTTWIRSFGSANGLEAIPSIARSLGLKVAASAWIGTDLSQNEKEIANLILLAKSGSVDIAVVGSEVLLRNKVPKDTCSAT